MMLALFTIHFLMNLLTFGRDKTNYFGETFSEISSDENYYNTFRRHKQSFEITNSDMYNMQHDDSPINVLFSMTEFNNVLKYCKVYSPAVRQYTLCILYALTTC